ncbi:MAG: phage tail tube protein [Gluconobacter sp.]
MSFSGATSGYQAGAQSNDVRLSYSLEANYGQASTGTYQLTRFTGENFRPQRTRQRPEEINAQAEASQAVTTQISVSGTLSGALSSGTYDDLFAGVLCSDWVNGVITNGTVVKTWTIREKMASAWFLRTGSFTSRAQITLQQGSFAQVAFDFACSNESKSDVDVAGVEIAAPTGLVFDTVNGFQSLTIDAAVPDGCIRQVQITLDRDGAGQDYGMGHADACGMRPGSLLASGQIQLFFKSFAQYDRFQQEKGGPIAITAVDASGRGYTFTFLNATLQNPQINAGSKNSTIVATFDIEGNPQTGGGTFTITKVGG